MGVQSNQAKRENITAANLLLSLSIIPIKINKKSNNRRKKKNGVFECKTCNREFPSFQALGGHCTSHLRPKVRVNGIDLKIGEKFKEPTKHSCSFCGKEFPMGQALGGHMRMHRVSPVLTSAPLAQISHEEDQFDLSMLPTMKYEKSGFYIDGDVISEGFQGRLLNLFV
ncbi:zinc finger protein ZAT11-like protein [Carex littledalei]|uniref:Zinc finger protein ZAT11-like protein n=1 Tax=Carex littledalei TaxID=544730 RepID=A0A833RFR2_9POAL|nr:zinc finger protein ZAT11-like protein [Carex littledalei]